MTTAHRWWMTWLLLTALAASACGSGGGELSTLEQGPRRIEVFSEMTGRQAEELASVVEAFERHRGQDLVVVGSSSFVTDLHERLSEGDAPDVILTSELGLLDELHGQGRLQQLAPATTEGPDLGLRLVQGSPRYASPARLTVVGLVWYAPSRLEDLAISVPATLDELARIGDRRAAKDLPTWCMGVDAETIPGWPATDWIESLLLRLGGVDAYDDWASGLALFTSQEVLDAFQMWDAFVLRSPRLLGGVHRAISTNWVDAIELLADDAPTCLFSLAPGFLADHLPDKTIAPDGDLWAFLLPPEEGATAVVEVTGTFAALLSDQPLAAELVQWLSTEEAAARWPKGTGTVVPGVDLGEDAAAIDRFVSDLIGGGRPLRYDASEQMPPEVGEQAFPQGVIEVLAGADLDWVLNQIDRRGGTGGSVGASAPSTPDPGELLAPGPEDPTPGS